nr:hypothetical protein [Tanacetum cinerariifolium]
MSNTLHNAIMKAGGKDCLPMLASDKEVLISEGSSVTTTETYMENYKNVSQDIRDQLNAEAKIVQIILTGIDNDIYSTVDACPNACEMWIGIKRLKQGESINVQDFETNLYWEFGKFTSRDGESLESYYSRSQQAVTRNRGKAIVNSPPPIYDHEPSMIAEDDKIECQKPKRAKDAAYHREKMVLYKQEEAGIQLNADQADWRDDTDDESEDQELEAHYMYMAQIQEVSPYAADSGPIFDSEPVQKINQNDDDDDDLANEQEMVADLRYFNSLELEVDYLKSQLETQKTRFLNEIDRLSREYYYDDHMNAILSVYTELNEVTNLQCDYLELLEKCECLENKLSKSKMMSKSFEALQKYAINPEIDLQQCQEKIKHDKSFKENQSKEFRKEREQYFEIHGLKAQLQDKGIVIMVLSFTTISKLARWNLSFFKLEFTMLTLGSSFGTSTIIVLEERLGSSDCTKYRDQKACSADNSVCALKETLSKLKGKAVVNEAVTLHPIDPELLKIDVAPLALKLRNNRTAHTDYLRHTQEETATHREIVKSERLLNPLNTSLDYACKYTKRIQELLIILQQTYPYINDLGTKLMVVTPKNNDKKIRFTEHILSSGNTPVKKTSSTNVVSNTPLLSSTGVNSLSNASRSQPQGNTKKDRIQRTQKQANWRDDSDDESEDQELEAHYMYMAQIQEVSLDAADSGPIFDSEPVQKVSTDDHYNVFAIKSEHPEQSESVHDTYPIEQDEHNVIIDSLDMSYDREQIDQNDDDDDDLANERELLTFLIEKLKCEIDDSKNRNKFLKTSNKVLIEQLKGEIDDFKTQNKSLESSNNRFKEANNKLSETNALMCKDLKKFQTELDRRNDVEYVSKVEIDCAKAKGYLISYKMESQKSFNKYT